MFYSAMYKFPLRLGAFGASPGATAPGTSPGARMGFPGAEMG